MVLLTTKPYYTWYALRDEFLVNEFETYLKDGGEDGERGMEEEEEEENSIVRKQNTGLFKCIVFAGGAGTGKTRILIHLANKHRICFICPTNVSGNVLNTMLNNSTLYGSKTYTTFLTMYKFFGETVPMMELYTKMLFESFNFEAASGNIKSLSKFFTQYNKIFSIISEMRYQHMAVKNNYITPKKYKAAKISAIKCGWFEAHHFVDENEGIVQYMLDSGLAHNSTLPNPLLFDTYVIDEAGRLPALEGLLLIHYDIWVHKFYKTCHQHTRKPGMIIVGSCTQSKVINKDAETRAINNYSMITMLAAPFFRNEPFMCKLNVFNRRCNTGDLKKMTCLSHLIELLEMGLSLPQKNKIEFLEKFATPFFKPSKEELNTHIDQIVGRLHIAKLHRTLNDLQQMLIPVLKSQSVIEFFACSNSACGNIPVVYRAEEKLGACYKSAMYTSAKWICGHEKEPIFSHNPDDKNAEKMWKYSNKRDIFLNMIYKITHRVKCVLVAIDGSIEDFLADIEIYKSVLSVPIKEILIKVISYMTNISDLIQLHSQQLYDSIANLSDLMNTLSAASTDEDDDVHNMSYLHSIQVEVVTCLNKIVNIMPKEDAVPIKIALVVKQCTLAQGMTCIVEKVFPESITVKVGKTLRFKMYKKCVKMNKTTITDFSTDSNRHRQENQDKKKRRIQDRGDYTDEEDDEEYDEDYNIAPFVQLQIEQQQQMQQQQQMMSDDKFILFLFYPIKLFTIETIDCTQSASFDFVHAVELTPNMSAEDLIVACTRAKNINDLRVFFKGDPGSFEVVPINKITQSTNTIMNRNQKGRL
ncbi:Hypothetical predicted protein [Mytilus galloprovincialis]|uniref:Uncharacterized protein n=1 Tax=Mytilus galloprovincialis TaxID=29158 RepID=A0A8B6BIN4_MYTGA|nr:Hypothetical predicted protein [Mytilus galloprovincialis]